MEDVFGIPRRSRLVRMNLGWSSLDILLLLARAENLILVPFFSLKAIQFWGYYVTPFEACQRKRKIRKDSGGQTNDKWGDSWKVREREILFNHEVEQKIRAIRSEMENVTTLGLHLWNCLEISLRRLFKALTSSSSMKEISQYFMSGFATIWWGKVRFFAKSSNRKSTS